MATKNAKTDLEITLVKVDIPSRKSYKDSSHIVTANLLWPRVGIAKRSAERELRLKAGACDMAGAPWNERILFKESCEGRFALQVLLTMSLTRNALRAFRRSVLGYVLKSAGTIADIAGVAGELAEAPLKVAAKDLTDSGKEPELLAQGTADLDVASLADDDVTTLEIPLVSARDILKISRRFKEPAVVGTATLLIKKI